MSTPNPKRMLVSGTPLNVAPDANVAPPAPARCDDSCATAVPGTTTSAMAAQRTAAQRRTPVSTPGLRHMDLDVPMADCFRGTLDRLVRNRDGEGVQVVSRLTVVVDRHREAARRSILLARAGE